MGKQYHLPYAATEQFFEFATASALLEAMASFLKVLDESKVTVLGVHVGYDVECADWTGRLNYETP